MQITLRMARENCRMSVEEAAKRVGITPKQLMRIEMNPGKTKVNMLIKISLIYGIARLDQIYIGSEEAWEGYCINLLANRLAESARLAHELKGEERIS